MKGFDEVIMQLSEKRKCTLLLSKGNVIKIKSQYSANFLDDLAYFKAVCDCYMATIHHSTVWIVSVNHEESIIELGYNY